MARLFLIECIYQYKLVVDGQWILDPLNPQEAPNDFGGRNNVLTVEP